MTHDPNIEVGLNMIARLKEAGLPEDVIAQLANPNSDSSKNAVLSRHWFVVGTQLRCAAHEAGIPLD